MKNMSSLLGKIKGIFGFKNTKKNKIFFVLFFVLIFLGISVARPAYSASWWFIDEMALAFATMITQILLLIAQLFIQLTVWVSQFFIVVASYSDFINSSAVKLGWVLVRDVVNMFFVLILLVIAFATVLGIPNYEWQKLMIKLLFAAVLVNFSRLICGVIIDVSQVFMMTFVNGFAATAGGNVINGLNLNTLYSYSKEMSISDSAIYGKAGSATDVFITGIAAVFFAVISFFVLGAYAFIMLARVVALWTLIILSPIAFISSVLPATQKYAAEWWKEFNNHVLAGPILAFFFWLSFAIVGDGNSFNEFTVSSKDQAEVEGLFSTTGTGISEAMGWGKMASFAIAIALLMTGVKKTNELGVTGASALSAAMSTARKVATVASGARIAMWAGQKAPLVGTDELQRYGRAAKGFGQFQMNRFGRWRDDIAGKAAKEGGVSGFLTEHLYQTGMRKDAKAENWERAAEYANTVHDKTISTGTTLGNELKTQYRNLAEEAEMKFSKNKGIEKSLQAKERLQAGQNPEGFLKGKIFGKTADIYNEVLGKVVVPSGVMVEELTKKTSEEEKRRSIKQRKEWIEAGGINKKTGEKDKKSKEYIGLLKNNARAGFVNKITEDNVARKQSQIATAEEGTLREKSEIDELMAETDKINARVETMQKAFKAEDEKSADEQKKSVFGDTEYGQYRDREKEAKLASQQIKEELSGKETLKELQRIEELLRDKNNPSNFALARNRINTLNAQIENQQEIQGTDKQKAVFNARGDEYERNGDVLRAALARQQASSLEQNKLKEVFKSADLGSNERATLSSQLLSKISGASTFEERKKYTNQKDALDDLNLTLGAYDAQKQEDEDLKQIGWKGDSTAENAHLRWLSRKVGRQVEEKDFDKTMKEYESVIGQDEFKVRMRQFGAHAKNQKAQGNQSVFVFDEESDKDAKGNLTGMLNYKVVGRTADQSVGEIKAWTDAGDVDARKIKRAYGNRNQNARLSKINVKEAELNARTSGSYTDQTVNNIIKMTHIQDLDNSDVDLASFELQLAELAKRANSIKCFKKLATDGLKTITAKLGVDENKIEAIFKANNKAIATISKNSGGGKKQNKKKGKT